MKKYDRLIEEGEFWNNKQKSSHSIHEISYRATFNPNLPKYFIEKFTKQNETVYDPFGGRGTTSLQAYLMNRNFISNDINPLMIALLKGRVNPPKISEVEDRLKKINLNKSIRLTKWEEENLTPFYNIKTLKQIKNLKNYFLNQKRDRVDDFILSVTLSRLSGHSKGYFSVYTLPPNQAVQPKRQLKINAKYNNDLSEFKDISPLILRKANSLLRQEINKWKVKEKYLTNDSRSTKSIKSNTVDLVVTSPPFINIVDYVGDNWIRNWFIDEIMSKDAITQTPSVDKWENFILDTLVELKRVVRPGGKIAFEVGEVSRGKLDLAINVMRLGEEAGLAVKKIYIHKHEFTKTSAIWGISNNKRGTNTNRVVLFEVKNV